MGDRAFECSSQGKGPRLLAPSTGWAADGLEGSATACVGRKRKGRARGRAVVIQCVGAGCHRAPARAANRCGPPSGQAAALGYKTVCWSPRLEEKLKWGQVGAPASPINPILQKARNLKQHGVPAPRSRTRGHRRRPESAPGGAGPGPSVGSEETRNSTRAGRG